MALAAALCAALTLPALAQTAMPMPSGGSVAASSALAVGTIRHIDAAQHVLTIEHQAIARMNMPGMTMQFRLDKGLSTDGLSVGQPIAFTLTQSSDGLAISEVQPIRVSAAAAPSAGASRPHHGMQGQDTSRMNMSRMDKEAMAKCHDMMMKPQ
ncbi:copper-binding protein [Variovorax durovernensis]